MKNRKLIYILAPLVILIWGAIAYSIFNHFRSPDVPDQDFTFQQKNNEIIDIDSTYTLLINYRDPFAPGYLQNNDEKPAEPAKQAINANLNVWVNWPMVEYKGMIMNEKKQVALIRIENSNFLLKEGDEMRQIKLSKIYADSVLLIYRNNKKVFIKNKQIPN